MLANHIPNDVWHKRGQNYPPFQHITYTEKAKKERYKDLKVKIVQGLRENQTNESE